MQELDKQEKSPRKNEDNGGGRALGALGIIFDEDSDGDRTAKDDSDGRDDQ